MSTNLSRRAILAGAASVPALALPVAVPLALPATIEPAAAPDPVIALAARAIEAEDAHAAACVARNEPERAFLDWKKINPAPNEDNFQTPQEARAAISRWRRRMSAARRRTGFAEAEANQGDACEASWDAQQALAAAVPLTLAGLAAKARAWRCLHEQIEDIVDDIVYSLARDIDVMAGGVDREAVQ
jgi:hypothetical protein